MGKPKLGAAFLAAILLTSFYVALTKSHVNATPSSSVVPPEGSIVVPDDYATINEAVDNAPEGGTVFVRSGNYSERIRVTKPLSLLGEDPQNTVISISDLPFLVYGAIEVLAEDVTISGFTIKNTWIGIWTPVDYTIPPRSRCEIIGNNIIDNFRSGISIGAGENNVVSGNNITGNGEVGIGLGSPNSVISGNNITGNGYVGITVDSCSNVTISENSITGNGVDIDASSDFVGGLRLGWDGSFHVYGNNITDNQGYGIEFAEGCYNSTVYQNNIARNSIGVNLFNFGVYGTASIGLGNIVYRNNIVDNLQQAFVDQEWDLAEMFPEYSNGTDVVSWDNGKEGNYWSDYQTRYPNAKEKGSSGIGDTPYIIDENNTDHYPLMTPVTISSTPPPISEPSSDSLPTIAAFVAAVIIGLVVVFFVYRAHRKREASNFGYLGNEKAINLLQLKRVVIFVSAVIHNETPENSAALNHIQLCVPL